MPKLSKAQIAKAMKKYAIRFVPKYRSFNILQNNIEDVMEKFTQMWKITYGLAIVKEGEHEPIEVKDDDNNEGTIEGDTKMKVDDQAIVEVEQQEKKSAQDTQLPNVNPQQITSVNTKIVTVKDVSNLIAQNINPLTEEDLKKILDQSTLYTKLCDNPILVSVDELQKIMTNTKREDVNTQEPPTITHQVTCVQPLDKVPKATLEKVDIVEVDTLETLATTEE